MNKLIRKLISLCLVLIFGILQFAPTSYAQAIVSSLVLPPAGSKIELTNAYAPACIKGIEINPSDSLKFNFLIDQGDEHLTDAAKKENYNKLIRYFLASLTMPEDAMWVNLSPLEKDRIIPEKFGQTEMGRDLLTQDYVLKQLTASLIYPESELGKSFWAKVYQQINAKYGMIDIPVDTFNKVWILPDEATVYERGNRAFVVSSHLKVMLETDYLTTLNAQMPTGGHVALDADMAKGNVSPSTLPISHPSNAKALQVSTPLPNVQAATLAPNIQDISKNIIREIIIPLIEQEVNEGKNFTQLRQITNSLILATWFKRKVMSGMNVKATQGSGRTTDNPLVDYIGHQKISGIDLANKADKDKIYAQYLEAFKTGVFNFIKEEYDPNTKQMIPRKYFSGGWTGKDYAQITKVVTNPTRLDLKALNRLAASKLDSAMVILDRISASKAQQLEIIYEGESAFAYIRHLKKEGPLTTVFWDEEEILASAALSLIRSKQKLDRLYSPKVTITQDGRNVFLEDSRRHVLSDEIVLKGITRKVEQSRKRLSLARQRYDEEKYDIAATQLRRLRSIHIKDDPDNLVLIKQISQAIELVEGTSTRDDNAMKEVDHDLPIVEESSLFFDEIKGRLGKDTKEAQAFMVTFNGYPAVFKRRLALIPSSGQSSDSEELAKLREYPVLCELDSLRKATQLKFEKRTFTPVPFAKVVDSTGRAVGIIESYIPGKNYINILINFIKKEGISAIELIEIYRQLKNQVEILIAAGIYNDGLTFENIIVDFEGDRPVVFIIDFDDLWARQQKKSVISVVNAMHEATCRVIFFNMDYLDVIKRGESGWVNIQRLFEGIFKVLNEMSSNSDSEIVWLRRDLKGLEALRTKIFERKALIEYKHKNSVDVSWIYYGQQLDRFINSQELHNAERFLKETVHLFKIYAQIINSEKNKFRNPILLNKLQLIKMELQRLRLRIERADVVSQIGALMNIGEIEEGLLTDRADKSIVSSTDRLNALGGINLDLANMNLKVKRDTRLQALSFESQLIEDINVEGFSPVIINISPVTNLPVLLGIAK